MCCAGTVATRVRPASESRPIASARRAASARALAASKPQGLACGTGSPVDPEVSTWAATRSAASCGLAGAVAPTAAEASVDDARQAVALALGFDQRIGAGETRAQPLDRVRRVVRRQQAGVAAQQRRAEADREPVAVDREIEHRPGRRQPLGEGGGVGQVLAPADRDAVAARDRRLERAGAEQRFARHGARSAGAASAPRIGVHRSASVARSNSGCRR